MPFGNPKGAITQGQLQIIANICKYSVSTFEERRRRGRKYYVALVEAQIKAGKEVSEWQIKEMNVLKAEIAAEQSGGRTEARG